MYFYCSGITSYKAVALLSIWNSSGLIVDNRKIISLAGIGFFVVTLQIWIPQFQRGLAWTVEIALRRAREYIPWYFNLRSFLLLERSRRTRILQRVEFVKSKHSISLNLFILTISDDDAFKERGTRKVNRVNIFRQLSISLDLRVDLYRTRDSKDSEYNDIDGIAIFILLNMIYLEWWKQRTMTV